jgi:hypothetical protein
LVTLAVLDGCVAGHHVSGSSAPNGLGVVGHISLTVNAHVFAMPVTCRTVAGVLTATGGVAGRSISSTISGAAPTMVFTDVGPNGAEFYQARHGMIDRAGHPASRMTVRRVGLEYTGDLTFVVVTVAHGGRKVPVRAGAEVVSGRYTLTCGNSGS